MIPTKRLIATHQRDASILAAGQRYTMNTVLLDMSDAEDAAKRSARYSEESAKTYSAARILLGVTGSDQFFA